ncbi:hypothetical protein V8E52_008094 [Russula decolorans]|jgi:hypothetical protein
MFTGARRCRSFPGRNAWLELVRGTQGSPKCRFRSYHTRYCPPGPDPLASAQLLVRRASVLEYRLKGRWNNNKRGIQHIHFLWTSISESVQAAIQQLFDASIMLDDSGFRDFVGASCKLSLEMVSMQVFVDGTVGTALSAYAVSSKLARICHYGRRQRAVS